MKGIDISAWQENVDWEAVKAAGIEFVILKLGEAMRLDEMFTTHLRDARAAGMKIGVYYYTKVRSASEAVCEAHWVFEQVYPRFYCCPEMGIWYDVEDPAMEGSDLTSICREFVEALHGVGLKDIGIYSSYNWLTNFINAASLDMPMWVAQYNSTCDFQHPKLKLWQYTDHYSDELPYDGNLTM